MVGTVTARTVLMGPPVVAGQQAGQCLLKILLGARTSFDQGEPGRGMWCEDVHQSTAERAAKPEHGRGQIYEPLGACVKRKLGRLHPSIVPDQHDRGRTLLAVGTNHVLRSRTAREVVARDGVMILAVVLARVHMYRRRAEPGRGVQHRVTDALGDTVSF